MLDRVCRPVGWSDGHVDPVVRTGPLVLQLVMPGEAGQVECSLTAGQGEMVGVSAAREWRNMPYRADVRAVRSLQADNHRGSHVRVDALPFHAVRGPGIDR